MKTPQTPQEFRDYLTEEPEGIEDEQIVEAENMAPVTEAPDADQFPK